MHLLPGTCRVGYKLVLKKQFYWLKAITSSVTKFPILYNCKLHRYVCGTGQQLTIPMALSVSKNIHLCSNKNFDHETMEEMTITTTNLELEDRSEVFRNMLYPMSTDPIIVQLKSSDSVKQLKRVIDNNSLSLTSKHYCQFILVLWDLVKNDSELSSLYILDSNSAIIKSIVHGPETSITLRNINDSYIYTTIAEALDYLSTNAESLQADELVFSVLYFSRFGIHLKNSSIQKMLQNIYKLLKSEDYSVLPLSLLSRITLIFGEEQELWTKLSLIKTLPFIYKYFDECSNLEDFKALTICMISTWPYLREELLVEYVALTEDLLRNGTITKDQLSVIVKAVMLLNHIYHKPAARKMMYRLMQMLNGQVNQLFLPHFISLQRIVSVNLEPYYMKLELENVKMSQSPQVVRILQEARSTFNRSVAPHQEGSISMKDLIKETNHLEELLSVYFSLTTAHLDVCHLFWDKMTQLLLPPDSTTLQYICMRYMLFTYRMGYYRHKRFECQMLSHITSELVTGSAVHRPYQFSILAAFVLSYESGQVCATSLTANIIPRLLSMVGQFSAYSCFLLSRALKEVHKRKSRILQEYLQLDSALNARIRDILESQKENYSISTFNTLLRTCVNKKKTLESEVILDIIKRCEKLDWTELTSRSLRNLVYNLQSTNSLVPVALDRMAEYCLDNRQAIMCETVGKLAHLCYYLGHSPTWDHQFWALTADLLIRDYKHVNGLTLLQVALALSFFNHLPLSLNRIIFSVDFLERLDEEIKNCFAKDKYPIRIRQTLMQLNRSVCLDNPEADVPWFHSKFCEEQQSIGKLDAKPKTLFSTDVFNTLSGLVGDASHIGYNVLIPYGYRVDFQLNLDTALNPVALGDSENVAHKLAMLLYYKDSYTMYEQKLSGYHQMKQRHLEILGYKVVGLSDTQWNAMWMTEPMAKYDYLRNIIWPS